MNTNETKRATSLRLNKGLYNRIEEDAKKQNRSINNFLEMLISEALNYQDPNEKTILDIKEAKTEKTSLKGYTNMNTLFEDLAK